MKVICFIRNGLVELENKNQENKKSKNLESVCHFLRFYLPHGLQKVILILLMSSILHVKIMKNRSFFYRKPIYKPRI